MGQTKYQYVSSMRKLNGKRGLGRPRHKWGDNVKT
jgi:hypothetical protein